MHIKIKKRMNNFHERAMSTNLDVHNKLSYFWIALGFALFVGLLFITIELAIGWDWRVAGAKLTSSFDQSSFVNLSIYSFIWSPVTCGLLLGLLQASSLLFLDK